MDNATDIQHIKRKSVSGVISYAVRTLALYAIGLVATGLLGYYLNPEDFGIYAIVSAVIGLFTFISDIGLAAALVQKKEEPTIEDLRTTFTVQQFLAFVIVILIVVLTPVWKGQRDINQPGLELMYALAFSFVLASFKTIPSIILERKLEFGKLVLPQLVENIIFYVVAVVLAAQGFGIRSYTVAVLLRSIAGLVVIYAIQGWPIGLAFSREAFRGLMKFGAKFQINDLLARLKDDLFIVVLAYFLPAAQMGYIGWAKRWSMFPYQFSVNSVMAVTFPTFSRLQDHPDKLQRAIEKSLFFISMVIFPILAGLSFIAGPLLEIIPRYGKWLPAIPSLIFFCINIAWAAVSTPLTNTLNAIGKINVTLRLMVMWTILTWTITPLMVFWFSFTGVAIASAVIASTSVITFVLIKRHVQVRIFEQIWRQLFATAVMLGVLLISRHYLPLSYGGLAALVGIGGVTYTLALLIVGYETVKREVYSIIKVS